MRNKRFVEIPDNNEPLIKKIIPYWKVIFLPKVSPRLPPNPIKADIVSKYTKTIHLIPAISVFKLVAMVKRDTLTIDPSIADINTPIEVIGKTVFIGSINRVLDGKSFSELLISRVSLAKPEFFLFR